jgi:hypothetical protein
MATIQANATVMGDAKDTAITRVVNAAAAASANEAGGNASILITANSELSYITAAENALNKGNKSIEQA